MPSYRIYAALAVTSGFFSSLSLFVAINATGRPLSILAGISSGLCCAWFAHRARDARDQAVE